MDINKLYEGEAVEMLKKLRDEGIITESDLSKAYNSTISSERKTAVELLHTMFCSGHVDNSCKFYDENAMDKAWSMEAHIYWNNRLLKFMEEYEINSLSGIIGVLTDLSRIAGEVVKARIPAQMLKEYFFSDLEVK